jgi:hypothetical protein
LEKFNPSVNPDTVIFNLFMPKRDFLRRWLVAVFAVETLCITYALKFPGLATVNSVLYFCCGITVAILFLFLPQIQRPAFDFPNRSRTYLKAFLIIATGILIFYFVYSIIQDSPIDYRNADMLPVIRKMNERFLDGKWAQVYDSIPEIWNGSKPVYLPGIWLPFAPAVALHMDLRWVTATSLLVVCTLPFLLVRLTQKSTLVLLIAAALLWWLLSENDTHGFISFSEEGVVVLYYCLLAIALATGNIYYISIAASLCMLSRYALIGWMPAFFTFLLLNRKYKQALLFSLTPLFFFLFFFIVPFGWKAFLHLMQLPSYYIDFSKRVWKDSPETFSDYIGFAKFFVPGKMRLLHTLLIGLSFIIPTGFILFCNYYKSKINLSNIALAALKISMVVFYNFIDVPYLYLFYSSTFVSFTAVVFFLQDEY